MNRNGYVISTNSENIKYKDICTESVYVNIAYNNERGSIEVVNNSLIEYENSYNIEGDYSNMAFDSEILGILSIDLCKTLQSLMSY